MRVGKPETPYLHRSGGSASRSEGGREEKRDALGSEGLGGCVVGVEVSDFALFKYNRVSFERHRREDGAGRRGRSEGKKAMYAVVSVKGLCDLGPNRLEGFAVSAPRSKEGLSHV